MTTHCLKLYLQQTNTTPSESVRSAAVLPEAFTILMCYFVLLRFSLMLMKLIGADMPELQRKLVVVSFAGFFLLSVLENKYQIMARKYNIDNKIIYCVVIHLW